MREGEEGGKESAETDLKKYLAFGLCMRSPKTYFILLYYYFQEKKIIEGMEAQLPQEATLKHRIHIHEPRGHCRVGGLISKVFLAFS